MSQRLPINPGLHLNKIVPPIENLNSIIKFSSFVSIIYYVDFLARFRSKNFSNIIISSTTRHHTFYRDILIKSSHVRGTAASVSRKHFLLLRLQIVSIKCSPNRNLARSVIYNVFTAYSWATIVRTSNHCKLLICSRLNALWDYLLLLLL